MAKTMAVITEGIVSNVVWCSDGEPETEAWKDTEDRPIDIGDSYEDGRFFRNGEEILTPLEAAEKKAWELGAQLDSLTEAYREGVNSV